MIQFRAILKTLAEHEVDYVVVGGVAAVLQGAPITTRDLDIVYSREADNPQRLLRALEAMHAVFRADRRRLRPDLSHLESAGHKLLDTDFGALDCLGTIEEATTYEDLLASVEQFELSELVIPVLSLERLIEVKSKLTRPKDRLMLLQLQATLGERHAASAPKPR
jgi:hypothetical protein